MGFWISILLFVINTGLLLLCIGGLIYLHTLQGWDHKPTWAEVRVKALEVHVGQV